MTMTTIKPGYLRVTDILSPFSGLSKIDPLVLQNAADRGTLVHEIIECIEQGFGKEWVPNHIEGYVESYERWAGDKSFLTSPKRLYDDNLMITGLVDSIYKDGEDLVLVDYKTPAKESRSWEMQASAYSHMCKNHGYNISRIEFIKLDKAGKDAKVFIYKEDMKMFRKILDCYRYFFEGKEQDNELDYI
jgi:hypothetical protein